MADLDDNFDLSDASAETQESSESSESLAESEARLEREGLPKLVELLLARVDEEAEAFGTEAARMAKGVEGRYDAAMSAEETDELQGFMRAEDELRGRAKKDVQAVLDGSYTPDAERSARHAELRQRRDELDRQWELLAETVAAEGEDEREVAAFALETQEDIPPMTEAGRRLNQVMREIREIDRELHMPSVGPAEMPPKDVPAKEGADEHPILLTKKKTGAEGPTNAPPPPPGSPDRPEWLRRKADAETDPAKKQEWTTKYLEEIHGPTERRKKAPEASVSSEKPATAGGTTAEKWQALYPDEEFTGERSAPTKERTQADRILSGEETIDWTEVEGDTTVSEVVRDDKRAPTSEQTAETPDTRVLEVARAEAVMRKRAVEEVKDMEALLQGLMNAAPVSVSKEGASASSESDDIMDAMRMLEDARSAWWKAMTAFETFKRGDASPAAQEAAQRFVEASAILKGALSEARETAMEIKSRQNDRRESEETKPKPGELPKDPMDILIDRKADKNVELPLPIDFTDDEDAEPVVAETPSSEAENESDKEKRKHILDRFALSPMAKDLAPTVMRNGARTWLGKFEAGALDPKASLEKKIASGERLKAKFASKESFTAYLATEAKKDPKYLEIIEGIDALTPDDIERLLSGIRAAIDGGIDVIRNAADEKSRADSEDDVVEKLSHSKIAKEFSETFSDQAVDGWIRSYKNGDLQDDETPDKKLSELEAMNGPLKDKASFIAFLRAKYPKDPQIKKEIALFEKLGQDDVEGVLEGFRSNIQAVIERIEDETEIKEAAAPSKETPTHSERHDGNAQIFEDLTKGFKEHLSLLEEKGVDLQRISNATQLLKAFTAAGIISKEESMRLQDNATRRNALYNTYSISMKKRNKRG